jgi:hypothetical protein
MALHLWAMVKRFVSTVANDRYCFNTLYVPHQRLNNYQALLFERGGEFILTVLLVVVVCFFYQRPKSVENNLLMLNNLNGSDTT